MEVANFGTAMDTLIDQDVVVYVGDKISVVIVCNLLQFMAVYWGNKCACLHELPTAPNLLADDACGYQCTGHHTGYTCGSNRYAMFRSFCEY